MADILMPNRGTGIDESEVSAISWAAVTAGGVAAAALTLLLLAFGAGLGLSSISPWSNSGASVTTFGVGAGIYLVVVAMIASSIGGYLAGRLRIKWAGVHTHEVYFRDTAHGFLAWAFATVLSAAVLGSAASQIVGGAAAGLGQAAGPAASQSSLADSSVDRLLRADPAATGNNNGNDAASRRELTRLMSSSLRDGSDIAAADRTYMVQVVAARTGLSPSDADKRVSDVITRAKMEADNARRTAAHLSLWLTVSLLMGAFSASLAATEGGGLRDGTWKY